MSDLMSTSLFAMASATTLATQPAGLTTPSPMPAGTSDAARFQSLMQAPDVPTTTANPTQTVVGQLPRPASVIGDGMVKASNEFKGVFSAAEKAAASGNLTVAEGLRLQVGVSQMLIHWDLLNKGISKTPQIVDTLVKTQ